MTPELTGHSTLDRSGVVALIRRWGEDLSATRSALSEIARVFAEQGAEFPGGPFALAFVEHFQKLFARYARDLLRLESAAAKQVGDRHIELVSRMLENAALEEEICAVFKRETLAAPGLPEDRRALVERLHKTVLEAMRGFRDLASLKRRLMDLAEVEAYNRSRLLLVCGLVAVLLAAVAWIWSLPLYGELTSNLLAFFAGASAAFVALYILDFRRRQKSREDAEIHKSH